MIKPEHKSPNKDVFEYAKVTNYRQSYQKPQ